jgi:hypothetical protein
MNTFKLAITVICMLSVVTAEAGPTEVKLNNLIKTVTALTARVAALEAQNAALKATDVALKATDANLIATDNALKATDTVLKTNDANLIATDNTLKAADATLTAKVNSVQAGNAALAELSTKLSIDPNSGNIVFEGPVLQPNPNATPINSMDLNSPIVESHTLVGTGVGLTPVHQYDQPDTEGNMHTIIGTTRNGATMLENKGFFFVDINGNLLDSNYHLKDDAGHYPMYVEAGTSSGWFYPNAKGVYPTAEQLVNNLGGWYAYEPANKLAFGNVKDFYNHTPNAKGIFPDAMGFYAGDINYHLTASVYN